MLHAKHNRCRVSKSVKANMCFSHCMSPHVHFPSQYTAPKPTWIDRRLRSTLGRQFLPVSLSPSAPHPAVSPYHLSLNGLLSMPPMRFPSGRSPPVPEWKSPPSPSPPPLALLVVPLSLPQPHPRHRPTPLHSLSKTFLQGTGFFLPR